jgi:hypothetical protein
MAPTPRPRVRTVTKANCGPRRLRPIAEIVQEMSSMGRSRGRGLRYLCDTALRPQRGYFIGFPSSEISSSPSS